VKTSAASYRLALAVTVTTAIFLVLSIGALGIIGAGGRPDRVFAAVLAVLAAGSLVARLRAGGMAVALAATALSQAVVTLAVFLTGQHHTQGASAVDIVGINVMFTALWCAAAWLFRRSADLVSPVASTPA
jgi:hypothetical protein